MANFQPSSLISEIRGSVGSLTYSRNRGGAVVKQKLIQPISNTALQIAVRAELAAAVLAWQTETQAVQDKWILFAASKFLSKNISRKIHRSGMNEYTSRYLNKNVIAGVTSPFEPLPSIRLFPVITSVVQGPGSIVINFDTLATIGNCKLAIYATQPISAGINAINLSFYRIIGIYDPAAQVDSVDIFGMYDSYYAPTGADSGKKIGIAMRAINTDNYASGQFFFVQAILSDLQQFSEQLFNDEYYNSQMQSFIQKARTEPSAMNKQRTKLWLFYRY